MHVIKCHWCLVHFHCGIMQLFRSSERVLHLIAAQCSSLYFCTRSASLWSVSCTIQWTDLCMWSNMSLWYYAAVQNGCIIMAVQLTVQHMHNVTVWVCHFCTRSINSSGSGMGVKRRQFECNSSQKLLLAACLYFHTFARSVCCCCCFNLINFN